MSNESFPSPLEAARKAQEKRPEDGSFPESDGTVDLETPLSRDSSVYQYLFTLQGEVEKEGGMDYHEYAHRLWREVEGTEDTESESYRIFERDLVAGLHDIEMKDIVYDHVREGVPKLAKQYANDIQHFSLWSTGDVKTTGYQVAKIDSARVSFPFMRAVAEHLKAGGDDSARTFLEEKTNFLVAEDKFAKMVEVVGKYGSEDAPAKVVIIEDSFGNFEKARERITAELGEGALHDGDVEKIWVLYSRSGITAREKAEQDEGAKAELDAKMQEAHTIESFTELLDEERFGSVFKDALVFCDFDGVIGDNLQMRDRQAAATMAALTHGIAIEQGTDMKTAYDQIIAKLSAK